MSTTATTAATASAARIFPPNLLNVSQFSGIPRLPKLSNTSATYP